MTAIVINAKALVQPSFSAQQFTATKYYSAEDKAKFANGMCKFIASGFDEKKFTKSIYNQLSTYCFYHIAHYNRDGFYAEWFDRLPDQVRFLKHTLKHPAMGEPEFTFSDVERALQQRLAQSGILASYEAMLQAETTARERALLATLAAKYPDAGVTAVQPATTPIVIRPEKPKAAAAAVQPTLF